jgi:hypothetical protein
MSSLGSPAMRAWGGNIVALQKGKARHVTGGRKRLGLGPWLLAPFDITSTHVLLDGHPQDSEMATREVKLDRLSTFPHAVFTVIITILVLEPSAISALGSSLFSPADSGERPSSERLVLYGGRLAANRGRGVPLWNDDARTIARTNRSYRCTEVSGRGQRGLIRLCLIVYLRAEASGVKMRANGDLLMQTPSPGSHDL